MRHLHEEEHPNRLLTAQKITKMVYLLILHRNEMMLIPLTQRQIEEWLHRNSEEFILCPFQPGNLRITRSGCRRRRMRAKAEDFAEVDRCDFSGLHTKEGFFFAETAGSQSVFHAGKDLQSDICGRQIEYPCRNRSNRIHKGGGSS